MKESLIQNTGSKVHFTILVLYKRLHFFEDIIMLVYIQAHTSGRELRKPVYKSAFVFLGRVKQKQGYVFVFPQHLIHIYVCFDKLLRENARFQLCCEWFWKTAIYLFQLYYLKDSQLGDVFP